MTRFAAASCPREPRAMGGYALSAHPWLWALARLIRPEIRHKLRGRRPIRGQQVQIRISQVSLGDRFLYKDSTSSSYESRCNNQLTAQENKSLGGDAIMVTAKLAVEMSAHPTLGPQAQFHESVVSAFALLCKD